PAACSPPCDLVPVILTSCNNQGTSNPADDTYSFTIFLPVGSGSVTSNGFNISGAETQNALAYGVTHGPFGNFLITGGDVSITLTDVDDPTCSVMKMITAPADCSVPCSLNPMIMAICDDNGTLDPNDDTYTYTITVLSGMSTGTSYSITGDDAQSNLPYDVTNGPFGPFPINGGDIDITITDDDDPFCNTAETVTAPGACSPLPASIGNYVWEDVNANGIQDDGPTGIGGVKVTLTGTDQYGNPVMDMQFTAPDGSYLFDNLIPGDYKLTFETPAGYTTTDVNQGGNDAADSDANPAMGGMTVVETLTSGENNTDYDAGYYLPAELGNYTWIDDDVDGQQDGGEQPLGGVTVVLSGTTGSGEPVNQTAITDANGLYLFDNLQPGTYKVTFQSPVGIYNSTQVDQGPDASDSDADPAMGG
ncbi:MAG: carboxypeptidase regulatory-like domain-containing protein, partial [Saprospiraceae bacterium]|nr:carboxypeptidase regulatory-like domain-containing protein [Saprospiraceae bacterium]